MTHRPIIIGLALSVATTIAPAIGVSAQAAAAPTAQPTAAAAAPADVATEDAIIKALYDVISGPAGQKRDWDRMRSLFQPGARLIPTFKAQDGTWQMRSWSVEEYITTVGGSLEQRGFFEVEAARRSERYGNMVHAWSTYESRWKAEDPAPFQRGINSIQMRYDGGRWWIATILWQGEGPDSPIPPRYLESERH